MSLVGSLMCQYQETFECPFVEPKTCISKTQVCDGIANCPTATEEDLDLCKFKFPSTATIKCHKKDIYNVNITIMAIPCDGIIECSDGSDEAYCVISDIHTVISVFLGYFLILFMTYLVWRREKVENAIGEDEDIDINESFLEAKHATEGLSTEITFWHENSDENERRNISQKLIEFENGIHSNKNEAICCLKVQLMHIFDNE